MDLLILYADAFERDADPDDFTLEAIIAHERGHQLLNRHPKLQTILAGRQSAVSEETLASLIGALIVQSAADRHSLVLKALADAVQCGMQTEEAARVVAQLTSYLETLL
ncbi:MAG: hypothetical protein HY721_29295 [Planctomycetes bacterium]|nr:hypothetical protein [Planctomycetota bacterium]